jgi:ATP-dependent RNA circularization protein (DNA/RNA ligase family)
VYYPKIETIFNRDLVTHRVLDEIRCPEFNLVNKWLITEKLDGMNIRVELNCGGGVTFCGRTDRADLPAPLLATLRQKLPKELVAGAFDPGTDAILFGEGIGPKIQKGDNLSPVHDFVLFDVLVFNGCQAETDKYWWLEWENVQDVAKKLGLQTVPVLGTYVGGLKYNDLAQLVNLTSSYASRNGGNINLQQEGVVARTVPQLFNRRGGRVMWKLKNSDFGSK